MNPLNKKFLTILKYALEGQKAEGCDDITIEEWKDLFKLAKIHNVLPIFFETVYDAKALKECDEPFVSIIKGTVMRNVTMQTITTSEFLALYNRLLSGGIKPLVVKGLVCRALYSKPDHRPSSDEDIWIQPEMFEDAHKILTDFGMEALISSKTQMEDYEVTYGKKGSNLRIELHKWLFPPESKAYGYLNEYFKDAHENAIALNINGQQVYTLDYTDNLFYLICHAFKHFLHSGFGIRQVADIVMFANEYGHSVDWDKVYASCKQIKADKFVAAMFNIGEKYLNFDPQKAGYSEKWQSINVDETDLLEELLSSGLFGSSTLSRVHSSSITLSAVSADKAGKKAKPSVVSSLFPGLKSMEERYHFLKKHPVLLPIAWGMRIVSYAKETAVTNNNSAKETLKIGKDRIKLMKKYGILK